jgi:2-dehydro-3-deoxyphosphogluconate aldolase/(4S)-4-hydroxy-2-oxoglutarate aldolase
MMTIEQILRIAPVIPVLVVDDLQLARPIAAALVSGGLPVLEVTLRTPSALDVIREMRKVDGAIVGAGTVLNPSHLHAALDAGSQFIVSPGLTASVAEAATESDVAFLPGVATASDIMRGLDCGLSHFKFFPATTNGGLPALKALAAPFSEIRFCPTGGITQESLPSWLSCDSVVCVGGSWLAPIGSSDIAAIERRAREASRWRGDRQ